MSIMKVMKSILVVVAVAMLAGCTDSSPRTEFIPASSFADGVTMLDGVEYLLQVTVEVRCSDSSPVGACVLTGTHKQICRWADCIEGAWVTPSMTFHADDNSPWYETAKNPTEIDLSGDMSRLLGVTVVTF